ncbi:FAD-dependent oxidoreductase, partial [Staphylococcus aureus]|uniref:FAD-dependent oxidoreductase n=1 Tax=Staphylococcus aureus TaxID=1280 RepID=UPI0037DA37AE
MIPAPYPIQYHPIVPTHLSPTLQTKIIKNLYTPGQINPTSPYQQPPPQPFIPPINPPRKVLNTPQNILTPSHPYIPLL